jgi:SAM-dependent methyltransferase
MKDVEDRVREFYDTEGWVIDGEGKTAEDRYFRNLGESRGAYDDKIRRRTVAHFEGLNGTLLIAGCGDLPASHILAAETFAKVICVDVSARALDIAKSKLSIKGEYHKTSIVNLPFLDNSVDAVLCAHVLYHIDKDNQGQAVRELIRVTKPGGRIVIIYRTRNAPLNLLQRSWQVSGINKILKKDKLYVYAYPRSWWSQFKRLCRVGILPCDVMSANQSRVFLPYVGLRGRFFRWAAQFEDQHADMATRLWTFSRIILDKLPASK